MDTLAEIDATGLAAAKAAALDNAYSQRTAAVYRNYADILYSRILDYIHPHKDKILDRLITAASVPNAPIKTKIWDYAVTHRVDGNVAQVSDMKSFSNRGNHTVLSDDGRLMSVDMIFRKSDIAWRLAFTFGSKYRVTFVQEHTKFLSGEYCSYQIAVYLHYHPDGLLPSAEESLIAAYNGVSGRVLHVGESVFMTPRY